MTSPRAIALLGFGFGALSVATNGLLVESVGELEGSATFSITVQAELTTIRGTAPFNIFAVGTATATSKFVGTSSFSIEAFGTLTEFGDYGNLVVNDVAENLVKPTDVSENTLIASDTIVSNIPISVIVLDVTEFTAIVSDRKA